MANTFSFVGYLKPIKDSEKMKGFQVTNYDSGWMSERLRFQVVAGDNSHFVEITVRMLSLSCPRNGTKFEKTSLSADVCKDLTCDFTKFTKRNF